jgi:hypothetical protein
MKDNYKNYYTLLKKKYPNYDWSMEDPEDYDTLIWNETATSKPTKEFLDNKLTLFANNYAANRKKDYPSLEEQFDMLWHAINEGKLDKTSSFYTTLKNIKDSYPKIDKK